MKYSIVLVWGLDQVFILLSYSFFIIDDKIHHRGLTGFRTGLSVMAATKLVDACFLRCFCWVLYRRGGGICGGGLLSTLGDVKGYGGIVWTVGGEITPDVSDQVLVWVTLLAPLEVV